MQFEQLVYTTHELKFSREAHLAIGAFLGASRWTLAVMDQGFDLSERHVTELDEIAATWLMHVTVRSVTYTDGHVPVFGERRAILDVIAERKEKFYPLLHKFLTAMIERYVFNQIGADPDPVDAINLAGNIIIELLDRGLI